jgi:hypothetical protein
MSDENIGKEDFITIIKYGHLWQVGKIKEEIEKILPDDYFLRWDKEDEYYYVCDNDCYLFISDKKIKLRSYRVNVDSSDKNIDFEINSKEDIKLAYEKFKSMTIETEIK